MNSEDEGRYLPLASDISVGSFQPSIHALDTASLTAGRGRKMQSVPSPQEAPRTMTELFHTHTVSLTWDWKEKQVTEIQAHVYIGV